MAYPFAPSPTFAEFKERLSKLGCAYKELTDALSDEKGAKETIRYFERKVNGEPKTVVIANYTNEEKMIPSVIRNVCSKLDLDPKDFGLTLG